MVIAQPASTQASDSETNRDRQRNREESLKMSKPQDRHHDHANGQHHEIPKTHLSTMGGHLVAASGEFVGTFFFLYFAYAGNIMVIKQGVSSAGDGTLSSEGVVFIALSYGLSLLVNVWTFYRISGGLFNPAVSACIFTGAKHSLPHLLSRMLMNETRSL